MTSATVEADPREAQRQEALALANEVRIARAQIRRDLRAGRIFIEELLADPPDCILNAPVDWLIGSAPRIGRARTAQALRAIKAGPKRRVGDLTERQRYLLAQVLLSLAGTRRPFRWGGEEQV
jgi:hypothetical protein